MKRKPSFEYKPRFHASEKEKEMRPIEVIAKPDIEAVAFAAADSAVQKIRDLISGPKEEINVVLPFGGTATKFLEQLQPLAKDLDLSKVYFIPSEQAWPIKPDHPGSFTVQINKFLEQLNLRDHLKSFDSQAKSIEEARKQWLEVTKNSIDLCILGLNESGAVCGLRHQAPTGERTYAGDLSKREEQVVDMNSIYDAGMQRTWDKFKEKFFPEGGEPSHMISLGYKPIVHSGELYILGGDQAKIDAVAMILKGSGASFKGSISGKFEREKKERSSASIISALRYKAGRPTSLYTTDASLKKVI